MKTIRGLLFTALAVLAFGACASSGDPAPDGPADVSVQIQNNTVPPTTLVVWLVPQTGTRDMLGTVDPNGTRTVSVEAPITPERYRFVAETTAGEVIVSRPFTVAEGDTSVRWDVNLNSVFTQ